MSDCSKQKVWITTAYHYQQGNFELHVETAGVDPAKNQWRWDIWRSQPFDKIIDSSDLESDRSSSYLTLAQARKQGLAELAKAVSGELVECKHCEGHGRVLKSGKRHIHKGEP